MKRFKKSLIIFILFSVGSSSLWAATHYGLINPAQYFPESVSKRLNLMAGYNQIAQQDAPPGVSPEMWAKIRKGLKNESVRLCFNAILRQDASNLTDEMKTFCQEHLSDVEQLVDLYKTLPAQDIPCHFSAPYIEDGCQGEGCGIRVDPIIATDTSLRTEIIDGKEIRILKTGEKLKQIVDFKIWVKKIGKVRALNEITTDQLQYGINVGSTYRVLAYIGEGMELGCAGDEKFTFAENIETLEEYDAENWVFVETEDGVKGYILYSALTRVDRG